MSQTIDQAEIVKLLIEAIDMFLICTALLTFGMGMCIMFYGSRSIQKPGMQVDNLHLGSFNLKKLKEGARIQSITQAKTRIGHAILLPRRRRLLLSRLATSPRQPPPQPPAGLPREENRSKETERRKGEEG
ncbi:hypothetical protein [Oryza sativa Japonica Group]|uniref:Uncharacterized protein n=2 Tax=Oryza TaxID=4527 RepID=Q5SMY8_ORYSJ|nr:hypothetical protein [Oryza sativa Japonica Group]BAD72417.1 hypothetical protein [Oryza sativa Japonica Group]